MQDHDRMTPAQQDAIAQAREIGREAARNAASWIADGNTKPEAIAYVLELFDAGDPAVDDYLPARPNLSGQWADELTPHSLADLVGQTINDLQEGELDEICGAFEEGVSETFESACETELRKWVS